MDLSIGLEYLAEWGISAEAMKRFEENEISLELMRCMHTDDMEELLPRIRERILFRSDGLQKMDKLINDTSSEAASSEVEHDLISSPPSSPASSSNELRPRGNSGETYYIPGLKCNNKYRPAKGKLINRYNNQSRLLNREGVLGRKRKLEIENLPEHSDIEQDDEAVIWLQYNKEPFHEIKSKWLKTRKYRMEADYKNAKQNLQDILKKFPLLKQSFGFHLMELDFEYRYPNKDISLFAKFPEFLERANDAFNDVKVFHDLRMVLNNTTKEDTKAIVTLSLLCGKLVPTVGRSERRKDKEEKRSSKGSAEKNKYTKSTILESRESFILQVKTQE